MSQPASSTSIDDQQVLDFIDDLPPSSKLVLTVLDYHGALTYQELRAETLLCESTLNHTLDNLDFEVDGSPILCVGSTSSDLREKVYRLNPILAEKPAVPLSPPEDTNKTDVIWENCLAL